LEALLSLILFKRIVNAIPGEKKIDNFIALTEFSKEKFIQAGLPSERIHVKPNFHQQDPGIGKYNGKYALYVGRISKEKGILTLLLAWKKIRGLPIKILGDGPLMEDILHIKTHNNLSNVSILGHQERKVVFQFIKNAKFILVPSEWYETFGLICAEAFACGKPVIASKLGSMAEIIEDGVTGLHFEAGNPTDLADKIKWLIEHPDKCRHMGKNARQVFLEKYTAEKNYKSLMDIYQQAINDYK
jgi:glycosyltransferase involved in cell wall biosynthesis